MSDKAPGVHVEERAGTPSTLRATNTNVYAIVGTAKRGPAKALLTSWDDFVRVFGGLKDDEVGPLSAYGFFAEGGQFLAYSRVKDAAARIGSRYVLDTSGKSVGLAATRWETGQQDISLSFRKGSSALAVDFPVALYSAGSGTVAIQQDPGDSVVKFYRSASDFLTKGYAVGQKITSYGWSDPANNGTFTITNVTQDYVTVSGATLVAEAAGNGKGIECTSFKVGSVNDFETGDILVFDKDVVAPSALYNNYLEVLSVEPSTGYINVCKRGLETAAKVPSGTALYTATRHRASTSLAAPLSTGSAQAVLSSSSNVQVGSVLLFLPDTVNHATLPFSRVVTGVAGNTVTLDGVPAGAYPAGSKVVTIEFDLRVKDAGRLAETYRNLSSSSTSASFFQDKLGPGVSFSYSSSPIATTGSDIDGSNTSFVLSDTVANLGLAVGDWVRLTLNSSGSATAEGLTAQVKSATGSTIKVDAYGLVPTAKTALLDVYRATPSIEESDSNKSQFIVLDNQGVYADSNQTTAMHVRVPYPYEDLAVTGGQYGSEPATTAAIIGSSTPGQKTGLYAFEDMDEFRQIAAFAIPGLVDSDTTSPSRQALDNLAMAWAETARTTYVTSVPSTITRALDAKSYRLNKLSAQNSRGALYFGGGKFYDPRDTSRVMNVPIDGWQLGTMALRGRDGIHLPPANIVFRTLFDVTNRVTAAEHAQLNAAGINVVLKKKGQGVKVMGARTLLSADGSMRHQLNCRQWLNVFAKTLEDQFESVLFNPAGTYIYDVIKQPINAYLSSQVQLGVFKYSSASGSFFVKAGPETTTSSDLADGQIYVHVGVSLAGSVENINFVVFGYEGEVNGVREV